MDLIPAAKFLARHIVGAGTSLIVHAIIKNNVSPDNFREKTEVAAGSLVLGSLVASVARKHTDAKIDEFVEYWKSEETPPEITEKEESEPEQ